MTNTASNNRLLALALALALGGVPLLSCFAAPEVCRLCNEGVPDGSIVAASGGEGGPRPGGTGGGSRGTGGQGGTAGRSGSGGTAATAGASGTLGRAGNGAAGATATGGSNSGGVGAVGSGSAGAGASGGMTGTSGSGGAGATEGGGGRAAGSGGATGGGDMASGGTGVSGGSSSGGAGGRGGTGTGGVGAIDPDLVLWYKFDESSGTTAADSAMFGGTARDGKVTNVSTGTASFSTTAKVGSHSVSLPGTSSSVGGYVSAPDLSAVAPNAITIACWIYITTDRAWQRVFDFGKAPASGDQPARYMFLTTHQASRSPGSLRFAITTNGNFNEESIEMSEPAVLPLNAWHHVAVTLGAGSTYTGTLYIDRAVAGTNTAMTLHWSDLGATDSNNFGRSLFTDPYFAGMLDDCRVYRRALAAAEIVALP